MPGRTELVGPTNRISAVVDEDSNLHIQKAPYPPIGGQTLMRVFRQYLTQDGTAGGTSDMLVNGSSTNVDYFVEAEDDVDRYICNMSWQIADANATMDKFGNITALTNGCVLEYSDEKGVVTIHEALKANYHMVRLCQGNPSFGDTTASFRASNVAGTSEGYIPILDLRKTFGFEWGLRLAAGTEQRLTFRIRDNVSALDALDCIVYGFTRAVRIGA